MLDGRDVRTNRKLRWRRPTAVVSVLALLLSMLTVVSATPAAAGVPDADVDAFVSTLDGPTDSVQAWTQQLATIGQLAEQLPGIPASAGQVLGFEDLLHQFFQTAFAGAMTQGDLNVDQDIDLGDGRTGHLTAAASDVTEGDEQLSVTLTASKMLDDQMLSVPLPIGGDSNAPQSAFSSAGGVSLTVDASFTFTLVWEDVSNTVSIVADGTTPRIDVNASAGITDLSAMTASIGVLGVSVVPNSNLDLAAHFTSTIDDPNNDGHLSFVEADGSPGELAQDGSLDGLLDMGFDTPAGHLNGSLHLNAAAGTDYALSLPAVDATIGIAWSDISTGTPTVTPTGIGTVGKFLNMTPRDLADGLGQLATALSGMQKSNIGDLDLPFVKGKLSDAIKLDEGLIEFLHDHTTTADEDPAAAGNPDFVSIQQLFDLLQTATLPDVSGGDIGIGAVTYDDATSKLAFELTLSRDAPGPVDLNGAGAASSGGGSGVTYGDMTLTDTTQTWEPDQFAGHHVVAGTSGGTIVSNTGSQLMLDSNGWSPTTPSPGVAYTISGMQGDVGTVQLGDALKAQGGIAAANGVNATAQVTPSYDATITLVLDLQPPTLQDPPMEISNPDGSTYLASATPIGADRVLLRTGDKPLFTADFPIDANADIFANAGFLQVELQGGVHVCAISAGLDCTATPDPSDHMLEVDLQDNGDLTFGDVVALLLGDPSSLLSFHTSIRAAGGVDASVPGAEDFLGSNTAHAEFHWNDLTQTSGSEGPQFDASDLSELLAFDFDPSNPRALFSIILKTLQTLDSALGNADPTDPGAAVFSEKIPVVGRSLRDLLRTDESGGGPTVSFTGNTLTDSSRSTGEGNAFTSDLVGRTVVVGTQVGVIASVTDDTLTMAADWTTTPAAGTSYVLRSELDDAISWLEAAPSDNLQELVRQLDERLSGTPLAFEYDTAADAVILHLDWTRSYHTSAPVQFDFNIPAGDFEVAGVKGSGSVALDAGGHIQMGIVIPLAPGDGPGGPGDLQILDDSSIGVNLDAEVSDAALTSTLGPLELSLGDPSDGGEKAMAQAKYSIDLADSTSTGTPVSFSTFMDDVGAELNASSDPAHCGLDGEGDLLALCANFPLYISTDGGSTYDKVIPTRAPTRSPSACRSRRRPPATTSTSPVLRSAATTGWRRPIRPTSPTPSSPTSSTSAR